MIFRANCEYSSFRLNPEVHLEIHWGIAPSWFLTPLTAKPWWDQREQISLGGKNVPTVSLENLFVLLCVHGSRHNWASLKWTIDLARLIEIRELNWQHILTQASCFNCHRMVHLGLLLTKQLYNLQILDRILNRIEKDELTEELSLKVTEGYYSDTPSGIFSWAAFLSKVQDGWPNRIRVWFGLGLTPTRVDWQSLPLPKYLYWFYFLYRPIRLFRWHILTHFSPFLRKTNLL